MCICFHFSIRTSILAQQGIDLYFLEDMILIVFDLRLSSDPVWRITKGREEVNNATMLSRWTFARSCRINLSIRGDPRVVCRLNGEVVRDKKFKD